MKITMAQTKLSKMPTIQKMETGTVFEFVDGVIALKLTNEQVLLLTYTSGNTYLDVAKGYLTKPIKKILGQIAEIVVE